MWMYLFIPGMVSVSQLGKALKKRSLWAVGEGQLPSQAFAFLGQVFENVAADAADIHDAFPVSSRATVFVSILSSGVATRLPQT